MQLIARDAIAASIGLNILHNALEATSETAGFLTIFCTDPSTSIGLMAI